MDTYNETFETWNKIASLYEDKFMHLDLYNQSYDSICAALSTPGAKILEIGCGPGNICKYLLSKRADFDILGIDVAPNMIALAQKNNPSARFLQLDSRNMHEIQERFEGIVAGFVLPYISPKDSLKFFSDCLRLLQEGGLLYISFVEGEPAQSGFKSGSSGDRCYFYYYSLQELLAQLDRCGFEQIEIQKVQYPRSATEFETHTIVILKTIHKV